MAAYSYLFALITTNLVFLFVNTEDPLIDADVVDGDNVQRKEIRLSEITRYFECQDDPNIQKEVQECQEMKPEKYKNITEECRSQILPGNTLEEQSQALCKNETGEDIRLIKCIDNQEKNTDVSKDEEAQMQKFIQCAMDFLDKHGTPN